MKIILRHELYSTDHETLNAHRYKIARIIGNVVLTACFYGNTRDLRVGDYLTEREVLYLSSNIGIEVWDLG